MFRKLKAYLRSLFVENAPVVENSLPNQQQLQLQNLHKRILQRIYHEDNLFVQRTYALITTHAFLAVALVTAFGHPEVFFIKYILMYFGLILTILQLALGLRTVRAIDFWHAYAVQVERGQPWQIDTALGQFFSENKFDLKWAGVSISGEDTRMSKMIPWRWLDPKATKLAGVYLPNILIFFWFGSFLTVALWQISDWNMYLITHPCISRWCMNSLEPIVHILLGVCVPTVLALGAVVVGFIKWKGYEHIKRPRS